MPVTYEVPSKISGVLYETLDAFENDIQVLPGIYFNQLDTLEVIEKYYDGKFISGDIDSEGFKKYFYNVSQHRCDTARKAIDVDTKNIRIFTDEGEHRLPAWLMNHELKDWMKEIGFGEVLNEIVSDYPKYGSVVFKLHGGGGRLDKVPYILDLKNLINDQTSWMLEDQNVMEKVCLTPTKLMQMKSWNQGAVKELLGMYAKARKSEIVVYDSYLFVPESYVKENGDPEKVLRYQTIVGGLEFEKPKTDYRKRGNRFGGIQLFEKVNPDFPYKELHWDRMRGRWLSKGIPEKLQDPQERINELMNLKSKAFHFSAKQLFQTRDNLVQKNVLTDALIGDVLNVSSEITPVDMRERELQGFAQELQIWESLCDRLSFSHEVATGEKLSSEATFRGTFLQREAVASYFEFQREKLGLFIQEIVKDLVMPKFKSDKKALHKLAVSSSDEELVELRGYIADTYVKQSALALAGKISTVEELEQIRLEARKRIGTKVSLEIPKDFYEDIKEKIDVAVTGEQMDFDAKVTTYTTILQVLGANPNLLQNPIMRKVFSRIIESSGENPGEILAGADFLQGQQGQPEQIAGSVARQRPNELVQSVKKQAL